MKIKYFPAIITCLFLLTCDLKNDLIYDQYLQVLMHYGFNNEVDTFNGKLTKDLILDGIVTVDFSFTTEEQMQIEEAIILNDFFNLPDTIQYFSGDSIDVLIYPNPGMQYLRVNYDNQDRKVYWSYPLPDNDDAQAIMAIYNVIRNVVQSTAVYQDLPEPRGGYN